ncbi:uncharacterized protein LOC127793118 [Diospyros lotus]|uniref:uncharacterized protein LOC127793118 n=1 Tax=Diospyros lotus TaxID=55363 RepID=UPI002257494C|nr:uncharacterized protein LOC127793118 [Diospyros lotus]
MEDEMNSERNGKKRVRGDSDLDSPQRKRVDSDVNSPEAKRLKEEPDLPPADLQAVNWDESDSSASEVNQIRDEILDIFDETDMVTDGDPAIKDLDSVIKSFEEEIMHPSPQPARMPEVLLSLEYGEPQPDLGFLLEASDDELGLPPTTSPAGDGTRSQVEHVESATVAPEVAVLNEILGLEGDLPTYDSFGFAVGEEPKSYNNGEFVTVGGLFDNDSSDFSDFLYRPESLPAL